MAIDYNTGISSLETGAPEIKYTGDEGPKSPQEEMQIAGGEYNRVLEILEKVRENIPLSDEEKMELQGLIKTLTAKGIPVEQLIGQEQGREGIQMASAADPLLQEEYDKYVFEMEEQGQKPMPLEDFRQQAVAGMATGGRAGYASGQLVKPGPGRPGYQGRGDYGYASYVEDKAAYDKQQKDENKGPLGISPGQSMAMVGNISLAGMTQKQAQAEVDRRNDREATAKAEAKAKIMEKTTARAKEEAKAEATAQKIQNIQKQKKAEAIKKYMFAKAQGFGIDEEEDLENLRDPFAPEKYEGELSALDELYSGEFGEKYGPYDTTDIKSHPDYEWKGGKDFDEKYGQGFGYIVGPYGNPIYTETGETEGINQVLDYDEDAALISKGLLTKADRIKAGGIKDIKIGSADTGSVLIDAGLNLLNPVRNKMLDVNTDYFIEKVAGTKGYGYTADDYKRYMKDRLAGKITATGNVHPNFMRDASGNLVERGDDRRGDFGDQGIAALPLTAQGTGTTAATTTTTTPDIPTESAALPYTINPLADDLTQGRGGWFYNDGGRVGYAGGGIADLRQGYFLGKIVKKLKRGAKKITKSKLGRAALLAGLGTWGFKNLEGISGLKELAGGSDWKADLVKGLLMKGGTDDQFSPWKLGIGAATLYPLIMGDDEKEDEGKMYEDWLKEKAKWDTRYAAIPTTSLPSPYTRYLMGAADGGRIGYQGGGYNDDDEEELPHRMAALRAMYGMRKNAQEGGLMDMGGMEKDYREEGGFVPIGGEERADDVPARLSKNEFVFTADAVRAAGGGDIDKGAEVMENVMENLEKGGNVSEESQGLEGARDMFATSQRLEGVL